MEVVQPPPDIDRRTGTDGMSTTDMAGQILRWSGDGQYRPDTGGQDMAEDRLDIRTDITINGLDEVRTALADFGLAAVRLSEALSVFDRKLSEPGSVRADTTDRTAPDTGTPSGRTYVYPTAGLLSDCPLRTDKTPHPLHSFGQVGGVCPGW